jgi:ABC-2 type transport system permease protein
MDIQRVLTLFRNDVRQGASNFLSIYVLIMPVLLSLLVGLVFGDLFAQKPRLGIYDGGGNASFVQPFVDHNSISTTLYPTEEALMAAVERGRVEMGMRLPGGFIDELKANSTEEINGYKMYVWGEAGSRSIVMLESVISRAFIDVSGLELSTQVNSIQLGEVNNATWAQRLMPLLILMAVVLAGIFIPATSLIEEKQRGTLMALTTTPTSLLDVYLSKTMLGVLLSVVMTFIVLILNRALNGQIGLLLLVVGLGALMNAALGVIMGSYAKDMDSFMAMIKAGGLFLYAPGILEMFPSIPAWVSKIFPTYYIMNPLLEITQRGAGFGDIALEVGILAGITALLIYFLTRVIDSQQQKLALA